MLLTLEVRLEQRLVLLNNLLGRRSRLRLLLRYFANRRLLIMTVLGLTNWRLVTINILDALVIVGDGSTYGRGRGRNRIVTGVFIQRQDSDDRSSL